MHRPLRLPVRWLRDVPHLSPSIAPLSDHISTLRTLQTRIQNIADETSSRCFYNGQLCLHLCLLKLKYFVDSCYREEERSSLAMKNKAMRNHQKFVRGLEFDSPNGVNQGKAERNASRLSDLPSPSSPSSDSQSSRSPSTPRNGRLCGARFAGGTFLVCFGRTLQMPPEPASAPPILHSAHDRSISRPQPFHIRSTSLTVTKSRGNSSTDEHVPR
jgi:hypothetical protein